MVPFTSASCTPNAGRVASSFPKPTHHRRIAACRAAATSRDTMKVQLVQESERVERGYKATEEDKRTIEEMAKALEELNPNPESLSAPELNGRWKLVYTTSEGILGINRLPGDFLRPTGPIFQTIDVGNLKARNNETWPLFNSVTANLIPVNKSLVKVQFEQFKIGNIIPIKAPSSAVGTLDITYVDKDLRISRGDKGNLFVLIMDDPTARLG